MQSFPIRNAMKDRNVRTARSQTGVDATLKSALEGSETYKRGQQ
jgi:hypothetical protein